MCGVDIGALRCVPLYSVPWALAAGETRGTQASRACIADASTTIHIGLERRSEDGIPKFLAKLREDFDLELVWTSFEEPDLEALLEASHIGSEAKPLQVYTATRRASPRREVEGQ